MDTEKKFAAAVRVIQNLPADGSYQPSNEMKLKFYSHYKQATQGDCVQARPGFWDPVSRAKHDAWALLIGTTKGDAMKGYVEALTQIIETINYSDYVEDFLEALGPFYDYVEEKNPGNCKPNDDLKNIGELVANGRVDGLLKDRHSTDTDGMTGKMGAVEQIINNGDMLCLSSSSSDDEEIIDEEESEHSLEEMLGKFVPPDAFNYANIQPDPDFIQDIQESERGMSNKTRGEFARRYEQEKILSNSMTMTRSFGIDQQLSSLTGTTTSNTATPSNIDLNHNNFKHEEDKFLDELQATHDSINSTKSLLNEIHRLKKNETDTKDQDYMVDQSEGENIENISNELTQTQIDRLLDRFDGFVPNPASQNIKGNSLPSQQTHETPSATDINGNMDSDNEDNDDVFEDTVEFTEASEIREEADNLVLGRPYHENPSDSRNSTDSLCLNSSEERQNVLKAPSHERKLSGALRQEMEDDQILIVSSHSQPETILMSNMSSQGRDTDTERFLEGVVAQLSMDVRVVNSSLSQLMSRFDNVTASLDSVSTGLDHVTARMGSLETNFQQINSRINTIEYLLQVVLSREERWVDYRAISLTIPLIGGVILFVAKVIYDKRR